jgi:hypothetical protein
LPRKLQDSGRAPSYRAIAEAILRNDLMLLSIGGASSKSDWFGVLVAQKKKTEDKQICLL